MTDQKINAIVLQIKHLREQINDDLLTMTFCKYSVEDFLTKTIDLARNHKLDPAKIFIDKRLYAGENAAATYEADCKILLECLEKFKLYVEMCDNFSEVFDPANTFKVSGNNIVVLKNGNKDNPQTTLRRP